MFRRLFRRTRYLINQFFRRSRTINSEPLNKVSLVVIILIDIFILVNVFVGLDDISRWHISPSQTYPCYAEWQTYQNSAAERREFETVSAAVRHSNDFSLTFRETYAQAETDHLGEVSLICLQYGDYQDAINRPENRQILDRLEQKQLQIAALEQANAQIRAQYDSTLLEEIAGQPADQSINAVRAAEAKQTLDQNDQQIATLEQERARLRAELLNQPESAEFLAFLNTEATFEQIETGYERAVFWYPTVQLGLQTLFLLPLIAIALTIHRAAQRKRYGLVALISWHLLVIFLIPLVIKLFEFLQIGIIFEFLVDVVSAVLGNLLFLVSYLYILLIPLAGFGLIKFFQKIVFNPKVQAAGRVQNRRCLRCAKRLRREDACCPHCGYCQYADCHHCHQPTYKHLPHCRACGHPQ
ncbi:MAG: hypothetical protein F6J97_17050 [Leptolyngbya sp. SIO4C1]|nr:hypothetical protein [Leptolyngbya sp. SIO4C1]